MCVYVYLKMARLSDHSTSGSRRLSLGRGFIKCCPPNTRAAYRALNTNDLFLQEMTQLVRYILLRHGKTMVWRP